MLVTRKTLQFEASTSVALGNRLAQVEQLCACYAFVLTLPNGGHAHVCKSQVQVIPQRDDKWIASKWLPLG